MTLTDIKLANAAIGHHWFSPDTMRFFRSRVSETIYTLPDGIGWLFVHSKQFVDSAHRAHAREYAVAWARPTGEVGHVGPYPFTDYTTGAQAHHAAQRWVQQCAQIPALWGWTAFEPVPIYPCEVDTKAFYL